VTWGPAHLWWPILGCIVLTALIKAAGPIALGGRELPRALTGVISLMAPALIAALVVTAAFADGQRLGVGANTAGVAVAAVFLWRGKSVVLAVFVAVAVTAALRAFL
jgi:branched-subunit amino acid transport protein